MLGLILALLYVAYSVVVSGIAVNIAVASTLGFLWTWHIVWTCVWALVLLVFFIIGIVTGRGVGALIFLVAVPLIAVIVAIHQTLFLGAVAVASRAGLETGQPNVTYLVIAGIMYLIAIVSMKGTGSAVSSSKSS